MMQIQKILLIAAGLLFAGFGVAYFAPIPFSVGATSVFVTQQGGTGTSSPSGILYGDNGATSHVNTVKIGSNLTFSAGTLSASGGSGTVTSITQGTGMLFSTSPITTTGTISLQNYISTSSAETSGRIPFWTSTAATPAALSGGSANLTFSTGGDTLLTVKNASTTAVSVSSWLGIPTSTAPTLTVAGSIAENTSAASSSIQAFGASQFGAYATSSVSFAYATSSPAGTTTIPIVLGPRGQVFNNIACFSVGGTADVQIGTGTASSTMVISSATKPSATILNSNNSFNAWQVLLIDIGTFSSTNVSYVSCGFGRSFSY